MSSPLVILVRFTLPESDYGYVIFKYLLYAVGGAQSKQAFLHSEVVQMRKEGGGGTSVFGFRLQLLLRSQNGHHVLAIPCRDVKYRDVLCLSS